MYSALICLANHGQYKYYVTRYLNIKSRNLNNIYGKRKIITHT